MEKLKLSLDQLHVESFRTRADDEERGTVNGQMVTLNTGCNTCQCGSTRVGNCFCTENLSCNCQ